MEPTPFLTGRNPRTMEEVTSPTSHGSIWKAHTENFEYCFEFKNGEISSGWVDILTLENAEVETSIA